MNQSNFKKNSYAYIRRIIQDETLHWLRLEETKKGVYEAFRNGVMYYDAPDTLWDSLWSKGYAKRSIQPYGMGGHRDIYYYSINENGLKEMEEYLGIKIKILR